MRRRVFALRISSRIHRKEKALAAVKDMLLSLRGCSEVGSTEYCRVPAAALRQSVWLPHGLSCDAANAMRPMRCGVCVCAWQMLRTIKTFRYRVVLIQRWWRVRPSTQPRPAACTPDGSETL